MARQSGIETRLRSLLDAASNRRGITRRAALLSPAATVLLVAPIAAIGFAQVTDDENGLQTSILEAPAELTYGIIEGRVYDKGTDEGVANTTIQFSVRGIDETTGTHEPTLSATTASNGRFRLRSPVGHNRPYRFFLPAGFVLPRDEVRRLPAVTESAPTVYDLPVYRGRSNSLVITDESGNPISSAMVSVEQVGQNGAKNDYVEIHNLSGKDGTAHITIPNKTLAWKITVVPNDPRQSYGMMGTLSIPENFSDPIRAYAKGDTGDTATIEVVDANGKLASIGAFAVGIEDGVIQFKCVLRTRPPSDQVMLTGKVVDAENTPLANVSVWTNSFTADVGDILVETDAEGQFTIDRLPKLSDGVNSPMVYPVLLSKEGYARKMVIAIPSIDDDKQVLQLPTTQLQPACEVIVTIQTSDGAIAPGMMFFLQLPDTELLIPYETDSNGVCRLSDLPEGDLVITAGYVTSNGNYYGRLPFVAKANEQGRYTLTLAKDGDETANSTAPPEQPVTTLDAGVVAPALDVTSWTDGQAHSLADLRGKVVVLDFWGTWCRACIGRFPAMKKLQERFKDTDVVFLGVHSAGYDVADVRRVLDQHDLDLPTGIDRGESIRTGISKRRFEVSAWPTDYIIGRDGVITYSLLHEYQEGDEQMWENLKAYANAAGMPAPIGIPAPVDAEARRVQSQRMENLYIHIMTEKINAALVK